MDGTAVQAAIREGLRILIERGAVAELRIVGTPKGTVSGYYNDLDKMAQDAAAWDGRAPAIYCSLNPAHPDLLARANNRLELYAKHTTSDQDILCRRWAPMDLDAARPAGISSTDAEHEAALTRAREVRAFLADLGWPDPVEADSGNGGHLLYPVDLPNDDASRDLLQRCVDALAFRFSDSIVTFDQKVINAARIWKLYGSLAARGDATPDRPHRRARILTFPAFLQPVPMELLEQLAAMAPKRTAARPSQPGGRFDLEGWLATSGLQVVQRKPWNGGTAWILSRCPWTPEHANRASFIVQFPDGGIDAGCHHNGCHGRGWPELRDLVEPGWRERPEKARKGTGQDAVAKETQAQALIRLAEDAELFHASDSDVGYASFQVEEHQETWPIRSRGFRRWLVRLFFGEQGKPPSAQGMTDALGLLEARAQFDGPPRQVWIRLAEHEGAIYLDLADQEWRAIAITQAGWAVVESPPVKFRRTRGMKPLPVPSPGGSIEDLRGFLNLGSEVDWKLVVAFLLGALRPRGPYPILITHGEQGSAKTSMERALRELVDPNGAPVRSEPADLRDLMIAAENGWLMALDNLSHLPSWLSDSLCRLATGGGHSTRELYSDLDEIIINATRPIILSGIEELASRWDLLDRAIIVYLPTIPEDRRRTEEELWSSFEAARPRILGALLDAVAIGLRNLPHVVLTALPRMADFSKWVVSCAPAVGWNPQDFLIAYRSNRLAAHDLTLEASPIAGPTRELAELSGAGGWTGTSSELLSLLNRPYSASGGVPPVGWPKTARGVSNAIRRITATLRSVGVDITFDREGKDRRRLITIRAAEKVGFFASAQSVASAKQGDGNGNDELQADAKDPSADAAADDQHFASAYRPPVTVRNDRAADAADAADDESPPFSSYCEEADRMTREDGEVVL